MNKFATSRLIVFFLVTIFALALLGIDVHYTYIIVKSEGMIVVEALGIACAVLTVVSMPTILFSLTGSFPTTVLFETLWLSILWVVWLITAAIASSLRSWTMKDLGSRGCSQLKGDLFLLCVELPAIEGLAHVIWLLMFSYCVALYTFSYNAIGGGHPNICYKLPPSATV